MSDASWMASCDGWLVMSGEIGSPARGEVLHAPLEFVVIEADEEVGADNLEVRSVDGTLFQHDGRLLLTVGTSTFVWEAPPRSFLAMADKDGHQFAGRISLAVSPYGHEVAATPMLASLVTVHWIVERIVVSRNLQPDVPDSDQWGDPEDLDIANWDTIDSLDRCWLQLAETNL